MTDLNSYDLDSIFGEDPITAEELELLATKGDELDALLASAIAECDSEE